MSVRVTYSTLHPVTGKKVVSLNATYEDADFAVMFPVEDQARLLAGLPVRVRTARTNLAWIGEVEVTASFNNLGAWRHITDCLAQILPDA